MNTLHGKSLIAGQPSAGGSGTSRPVSPLDGRPLDPPIHQADGDDVRRAAEAAEAAFLSYSTLPAVRRAEFLEQIAVEIEAIGDALPERAHIETALPLDRLEGERGRTCGHLRLFASVIREGSWVDARIDTALPDRKPLPRADLRRMLVPLGPVAVFGSSNFPLAYSVAGGDTASALAAGNPVIVKAHGAHPGTSEMVAEAVIRAACACGLPAGVFSMLHGRGEVEGIALVRDPRIRAVGFTGSQAAGRALFDAAASRPDPIPVFAEMASLNPVFLLPGALQGDSAVLAAGLKNSVTMGVGQFCTKPGLVFAMRSPELDAFIAHLCAEFEATAPATMLHSGICESFHAKAAEISNVPGVNILARSGKPANPDATEGASLLAQTSAATFLAQPALRETEVFGPFSLVVIAESAAELVALAESLTGQLTATLRGNPDDLASAGDLLAVLRRKAGRLIVNGFPTGVEVCPAMTHGGPYPATTDARFTSVGTAAILRFVRPVTWQNFPESLLPPELRNANPTGIMRLVNSELTRNPIS
jgi:NADP-dependent aldehyde dehydrogenase